MIYLIVAPPGAGKTVLLTHILNSYAYDYDRVAKMKEEINKLKKGGFKYKMPACICNANYDIEFSSYLCKNIKCNKINPFKLGYKNKFVEDTHFLAPYSVIGITEGQKYLNSRLSLYFPDWQSRWYEQHRHMHYDIFIDVQRDGLIDKNVRELAKYIEIVNLQVENDCYGDPCHLTWKVRIYENMYNYELSKNSGGNASLYTEKKIEADYNVFELYSSECCKSKFYDGHIYDTFDEKQVEKYEDKIDDYITYLENLDDEMPDGFLVKRKGS